MHKHVIPTIGTLAGGVLGAIVDPGQLFKIALFAFVGGACGEMAKHTVAWLKEKCRKKDQDF